MTTEITHSRTHNTEETYNAYLEEWRSLHACDQSDLRGCAYAELRGQGAEQISSSDVSRQVYAWFCEYGSLSPLVLQVLRDFYL